ncbi:MAG: hypothetical protein BGO41_04305 [Clostridiales bacterium 38-18]|nr:MAG: hypothetical protein BGO41_04305 [Clostridiales bacterium 38-18]
MKKSVIILGILLLISLFIFAGCQNDSQTTAESTTAEPETTVSSTGSELQEQLDLANQTITDLNEQITLLQDQLNSEQTSTISNTVLLSALDVVQALKDQDMSVVSNYVDATIGVRFTPYGYVDTSNDLSFSSTAIATLMQDNTLYTWGAYDGSGDPITKTFSDYFSEFVYDEDYISPHIIGINTVIGTGNSINNIATVYPTATFVEFHFTGFDPQYSGIDWSSLILVFEPVGSDWKLIGIVHNQWTI